MAKPPREYQTFAAELLEIKAGLLLADDVGLGKTVTSICSLTLPEQSASVGRLPDAAAFPVAGDVRRSSRRTCLVHILKKGTPYPLTRGTRRGQLELLDDRLPDVIISNYHKLRGWSETLAGVIRTVVFDECQQLRNPTSSIYHACTHVARKARRRLGLSATPIYNYGSEFFNVVDALTPGAWGERSEFIREWCKGQLGDKARIADTEQFGSYLGARESCSDAHASRSAANCPSSRSHSHRRSRRVGTRPPERQRRAAGEDRARPQRELPRREDESGRRVRRAHAASDGNRQGSVRR
jgi:SNF2 family DNA or RNA helicase